MNILVSPLNWGIGHATRLCPIIQILSQKHNVILSADGNSYSFLEKEFPELLILKAPSLEIKYSSFRFLMPVKIFLTIPKLMFFYYQNRKWIKKYIKNNKIDVIISDNRFGFFSKKIHSIFITHQLKIAVPNNLKVLEKIVFLINKFNIQKFDECWIPDNYKQISGKLSGDNKLKIPQKRIGVLSRFNKLETKRKVEKFDILVLISGPEPQRSKLEKIIKTSLKKNQYKVLILSGIPTVNNEEKYENITIKNHLSTNDFQTILQQTEIVIARAGYSTIMDLITLNKTAILIPTPGQTEQEYLANYLHNRKVFINVKQNNFHLETAVNQLIANKNELDRNVKKINIDFNLKKFLDKNIIRKN